ncbi:MAG: hypothetical protein KGM42_21575, partial [Hyphomicrobiales bacterium]|nr:hypothetical protein [Hyphomicrobiales bacterium]
MRAALLQTTATGAIRYIRTSDAELALRRAEQARIEAEQMAAELIRMAASQKEQAERKPSWVRFSRTPDNLLKKKSPEPADSGPPAAIEAPAQISETQAPEPVAAAEVAAIVDLVNCLHQDVRTPRQPLVEILIPRSPAMARTDIFLGDAAARVNIEEYDAPDLQRAPTGRRFHPQHNPLVRSEIDRLAEMLRSSTQDDTPSDEDARARALVETKPVVETPREKARVRVKAAMQPSQTATTQTPAARARPTRPRARLAGGFDMPALELLREHEESLYAVMAPEHLDDNARELEGVLEDFNVKGEIVNVRPGPVVTLYELEPAPGVKSSRVIGLADDIARSM